MIEVGTTNGRPAVRGDLDLLSIPALETWLDGLTDLTELDLSGVTFFDSSALRTFLSYRRRNVDMRIVNPSPAVLRVLEMTGTVDYLLHDQDLG